MRFASSLEIQEASTGQAKFSTVGVPEKQNWQETSRGKRQPLPNTHTSETLSLQTADMAKCDRPQRDDMNSNKAFTRQKTKT